MQNVSEASVHMFEYMLEDNEDLMDSFKEYFDNPEEDITFIKELMRKRRKVCTSIMKLLKNYM